MLGVGWTEMLVIGVVALIVIGPKDLPAMMQRVGRFAGTIRRMGQDFQRELNKTTGLNEITNLRNSVTAPLKATADAIRKEFNTTTATGTVEPSGAIKPADPKAESVVNEIREKAGMLPLTKEKAAEMRAKEAAESGSPSPAPAATPAEVTPPSTPAPIVATAAPAKPRRTPRIKVPAADTPVETDDLPQAAPAPIPAPRKKAARSLSQMVTDGEPLEAAAPRKRGAASKDTPSTATEDAAPTKRRTRKTTAPEKP